MQLRAKAFEIAVIYRQFQSWFIFVYAMIASHLILVTLINRVLILSMSLYAIYFMPHWDAKLSNLIGVVILLDIFMPGIVREYRLEGGDYLLSQQRDFQ